MSGARESTGTSGQARLTGVLTRVGEAVAVKDLDMWDVTLSGV